MEKVDSISFFMDQLLGYTTQAVLGFLALGSDPLSRALSVAPNQDLNYLRRVASKAVRDSNANISKEHKDELVNDIMMEEESKQGLNRDGG